MAGYDKTGPRLFRTCPSGMYYEYHAYGIGSRCQTANTYLENHLESFDSCSLDQLVKHAVEAMKKAQDITITEKNVDISIVGKDTEFKKLNEDEIKKILESGSGMVIDG